MRLPFAIICIFFFVTTSKAQIAVNEVMPVNNVTITDEDGAYESWIELYNYSDDDQELHGFGLSSRYNEDPYTWIFPDTTLPPGEFLLIWASGKDRDDPGSPLHTNFSIESEGDDVILTALGGTLADQITYSDVPSDYTIGRFPDGSGTVYIFDQPTPGAPNQEDGYQDILNPPEFNIPPGFYSGPVTLEIKHDDPDVTIFYTTDGAIPDDSSKQYTEPVELGYRGNDTNYVSMVRTNPTEFDETEFAWIPPDEPVDKGHTIRAVAVKSEYHHSPAATGTWFPEMEQTHLPVLSITAPYDAFFGSEEGIYVPGAIYDSLGFGSPPRGSHANYYFRGIEWEREASFEWFEDNARLFQQNLGVRIHGGSSRVIPMKSLRLYARSDYGQSNLRHKVFPDEPFSEFKRLLLRNSGQDFFRRTVMFRDAFMQELVADLNVQTQSYRPVILFLNGEYWGIHNIRERYDHHFFDRVYGVPEEHLDYLENEHEEITGSNAHYIEMLDYIEEHKDSLNVPPHLEHISGMMDLDNFIDYNILNIFFGNHDWPGNNIDFWRYSGPPRPDIPKHDGRWRWVVFDLDNGFGLRDGVGAWELDMIEYLLDPEELTYANQTWATFLIQSLMKNDDFRLAFLRRFSDLMNTTFRQDNMISLMDEMADVIRPEMPRHIQRWSIPLHMPRWENHIDFMHDFAKKREAHQISHIQNYFNVGDTVSVEIIPDGSSSGIVRLNSLEIPVSKIDTTLDFESGKWVGTYFSNIPLKLEAVPSAGYHFSHWEINGDSISDISMEVQLDGRTTITPYFEQTDDPGDTFPEPHILSDTTEFQFSYWSADQPAGVYPSHMAFVYMDEIEPSLKANIAGFSSGEYNLESRTRITGLGDEGFSFINTSNLGGNPGYPGRRLGGALLALNTENSKNIEVQWTAGTILPNSREYGLRLQYRIGNMGPFYDVTDPEGNPVEYIRSDSAGHQSTFEPISLPDHVAGQPHIELFWRYYHTGIRHDEISGARAKLNISSIVVNGERVTGGDNGSDDPDAFLLGQNYPNPFNSQTRIPITIAENAHVTITVYDITGRMVKTIADGTYAPGTHVIPFDAASLASGVYLYRMSTSYGYQETRKMLLLN